MTTPARFDKIFRLELQDLNYRYLRVTQKSGSRKITKEDLIASLGENIHSVSDLLPHVYRLPISTNFRKNMLYEQGLIFPMDLGSIIAVLNLDIKPDDQVLDLCCAPGAKLCYMIEILKSVERKANGMVTGVDVSLQRLNIAKALLKKYKLLDKARLFHTNGAENNLFLSTEFKENLRSITTAHKTEITKPIYASKMYRNKCFVLKTEEACIDPEFQNCYLYDKVIVDAECTHDGSVIHNIKLNQVEWKTRKNKNMKELYDLQLQLITNGYKHLKPKGTLIYSTCSFEIEQNEKIVLEFLKAHKFSNLKLELPSAVGINSYGIDAFQFSIEELRILFPEEYDLELLKMAQTGLRFCPSISGCSGLFVIRFKKP